MSAKCQALCMCVDEGVEGIGVKTAGNGKVGRGNEESWGKEGGTERKTREGMSNTENMFQ